MLHENLRLLKFFILGILLQVLFFEAWDFFGYIDPIFYTRQRPVGVDDEELSKNETRRIFIEEIFPQQDLIEGQSRIQNTFDLSYYPEEKGPYNNSLNSAFTLSPKKNWAGITREINSTNFEQANVEFVQFWLLDTFEENSSDQNNLGELVFNLGSISEDILKDGKNKIGEKLYAVSPLKNISVQVEVVSQHYVDPDGKRVRS